MHFGREVRVMRFVCLGLILLGSSASGCGSESSGKTINDVPSHPECDDNIELRSAEDVNEEFEGQKPPYEAGSEAVECDVKSSIRFVRVYTDGTTSPKGKWMMRGADMKSLSPEEIQLRWALPYTPTHIVDVTPPGGTRIRLGIAGPQQWEEDGEKQPGGGTQIELLDLIPGDSFSDGKPLQEEMAEAAE